MNKVMMIIMDGFGIAESSSKNAISQAQKPFIDKLFEKPKAILKCSGNAVGLPDGIMGNSEVGHLNFGAGRIVYQLNTLIDKKIEDRIFYQNKSFLDAFNHVKANNSKLHIFGLLSDGGVHSSMNHLWALLDLCKENNMQDVFYHAFMDGRDTYPNDGIRFMKKYLKKVEEVNLGQIASISGRYFAMDRDNRWERVEKAYRAIVEGKGESISDPLIAIQDSYNNNITDEFIIPKTVFTEGKPLATIEDNDAIIFINFRADRARQITRSFIYSDFTEFTTKKLSNTKFVSMTPYDINFEDYLTVAFRPPKMKNILGDYLSQQNVHQLRIAETEKYAHVTFFFNGGIEQPFPLEERRLISSPKVASYDLKPEMSAYEVTSTLIDEIKTNKFEFILINYANCDMVGHTGDMNATIKAVETVDDVLSKLIPIARQNNYNILVTADHGNAEKMLDQDNKIFTAHSKNNVPIIFDLRGNETINPKDGKLADVAPTILKIMGIPIPKEMTGDLLI